MKVYKSISLLPLASAISLIVLTLTLSFIYDIQKYPSWIKEGGVVETLSVVGYIGAAIYMTIKGGLNYIIKYYYFFILVLFFAMRELDFHKKFTTMGIFRSKFYLSSSVPVAEKFIGFLVIVLLLFLTVKIVKKHGKDFLEQLKRVSPVHVGVTLIFMTLFFAKAIDGLSRKLGQLKITISQETSTRFEVIEEIVEMGIPLIIIATLFSYFSLQKDDK